MGRAQANRVLGTQPGPERDEPAICLGHHLVQLGYLPGIPVKRYNQYMTGTEHVVLTKPKWVPLPASVRGRARRRRFQAKIRFSYNNAFGNEEGTGQQSPTFYFRLEPIGKHWEAQQYVSGLGMDEAARMIAPSMRFLARWDGSNVFTRERGGYLGIAGGPYYWVANNTLAWRDSDPAGPRAGRTGRDDPDSRWQHFLDGSRAGYIPGEEVPPRPPHPYWTVAQVEEWLRDPERIAAIQALFYADLWLAGLLVPGSEVDYDPITGGPAVRSNPPWRMNADPRLRQAQRRAATEQSVEALAALYHERMRVGDLHPANLWLAARIPPYNTCLAEVHNAAELAFGEEIPVARPLSGHSVYDTVRAVSSLFYSDLIHEEEEGASIPPDRLAQRLKALSWPVKRASISGHAPSEHALSLISCALSRSVNMESYRLASIASSHAIASSLMRLAHSPPDHFARFEILMGSLQRNLLRSPQ
jgi:hypothetical protein